MGISTSRAQKKAKPRIIQLSLKSGKYQLLRFPQISSMALCGLVPPIFLLVQIELNMGETQTHLAVYEHTKKKISVDIQKASVIYCTCADIHTVRTHGKPLPNPLPLTRVECKCGSEVPPLSARLIITDSLRHRPRCCPALEPPGEQLPHRWLAGQQPAQKTDMKASICEGVTL